MAEDDTSSDKTGDDAAKKRFPQLVNVAALVGRTVLEPLESQPILGHIEQIVRRETGEIDAVVTYGGLLGFGGRRIAVPIDAMALLGQYIEILDFKPEQLDQFPTFVSRDAVSLAGPETIKVGLARPSH